MIKRSGQIKAVDNIHSFNVFTFILGSSLYSDSLSFGMHLSDLPTVLSLSTLSLVRSSLCPSLTVWLACKLISVNHSCLLPAQRKTQE